ncbi:MAG: putative membrane-bound redox modulator Alx [Phycisphaerae bacterium]|nr:putative membrane-bound redox modulator Alx [Phycisphaerae bacterium]
MIWFWVGFIALVLIILALDLGIFHRQMHEIHTREALIWTAACISLALLFTVFVYFAYNHHWLGIGLNVGHSISGKDAAIQFLTGYIIEESLSLDNIFVFAMIFAYFRVPLLFQHRVLFWGILGALILRGLMIGIGVALISHFEWVIYLFGMILIYSAYKMLVSREEDFDPQTNPLIRLARRFLPISNEYDGAHFVTRIDGRRFYTPLFIVLLTVESSDVIFAIDSIPAIFAVTRDPFLVFTSNVFAILGLRSLYFALASMMKQFRYLKTSIVFVLAYVGVKMLLSKTYPIPSEVSLAVICIMITIGIMASWLVRERDNTQPPLP